MKIKKKLKSFPSEKLSAEEMKNIQGGGMCASHCRWLGVCVPCKK